MSGYASLLSAIHAYADRRLRPEEFSVIYFDLFTAASSLPPERYSALNRMFYAAEDFCADPAQRGNDLIGPEELLATAQDVLRELEEN